VRLQAAKTAQDWECWRDLVGALHATWHKEAQVSNLTLGVTQTCKQSIPFAILVRLVYGKMHGIPEDFAMIPWNYLPPLAANFREPRTETGCQE